MENIIFKFRSKKHYNYTHQYYCVTFIISRKLTKSWDNASQEHQNYFSLKGQSCRKEWDAFMEMSIDYDIRR